MHNAFYAPQLTLSIHIFYYMFRQKFGDHILTRIHENVTSTSLKPVNYGHKLHNLLITKWHVTCTLRPVYRYIILVFVTTNRQFKSYAIRKIREAAIAFNTSYHFTESY